MQQYGFPRGAGPVGFFIAAADVAVHLVVPTTVHDSRVAQAVVGFMGLLQLLFGAGITIALLRPVSGRLNGGWLAILIVFGTLIIGATAAWAVLPSIAFIFDTMVSLKSGLSTSFVVAIAATYASGIAIIKFFLGKPIHRLLDKATDSVADKAARLFVRYVP
jgi:hypothetical protein